MRIAVLSDDYLPNSTLSHAKILHDLSIELTKRGHEVVVITPGLPHQPTKLIKSSIDHINVWRFQSAPTRKIGRVQRAINESLLSYKAWNAIKNEINQSHFDLCINYSPTIFFGLLARKLKSRYHTKVYLILRDLFPQWIIDEGIISERSLAARYFRYFESINYDTSDYIGLMSKANLKLFQNLHPNRKNLCILRTWAAIPANPSSSNFNIRTTYGLDKKVIFFYGGNLGHAQDMTNIIRLISTMKKHEKAHFLLIGQGDQFNLVKNKKNELSLTNLTLLESISQEKYNEVLTQVDVGLFSLAKSHKAHNFPGKAIGYMTRSLPILGSINPGNDLIEFLNEKDAGFAFINGEDESLYQAALKLLENPSLRQSMGMNAFFVLKQYFSVEYAADSILSKFEDI